MRNLDEKINSVYNFMQQFIDDNGYPPSVREISAKLSIKSTATVYLYLEKLKERGLITKSPQKKRSLSINGVKNSYKSIPIVGTIRAGSPIFAVENLDGYCPLPDGLNTNDDYFALNVNGNSMIKAGIYNNDLIIVKKQNSAINGDIVVALIDDSATVKRFYKKENQIVLHPENDEMQDLIYPNVEILGIVKGLIRKF